MEKAFVYGMSVEGKNFTDRTKETERLTLDFENGINVVLISPRRMGKTSLVRIYLQAHRRPLPHWHEVKCRPHQAHTPGEGNHHDKKGGGVRGRLRV